MRIVNRHVVVLKPKQPFIDWANGLDPDGPPFDPDAEGEDGTAYLVPEVGTLAEIRDFVLRHSEEMFERELDAWQTDRTTWPRNRTYVQLQEWFEIRIFSLVFDLGQGAILLD